MNCPRCQTANPEGAKFCYNCGEPLPAVCPSCGTPVVPGARFCYNCGTPLAGPAPSAGSAPPGPDRRESADARLQQYIPKELLAKLEAARARRRQAGPAMEGERRVVTVLFSDVRGSTALAEGLDPEEWAEVMNGAFECLIKPVYRYEGIVARLMGDGILAFFGAPIAHEDDPQRAVQAGLDIVHEVQAYGERVRRERGLLLEVRVGINTGLAVVGEVGSDLRVEYTAMGDAVNLASRMEETARPGTVQITSDTYRFVAPLYEVEPLGNMEIRGKSESVPTYRVLGYKARPGRLRGIEGLSAPLVGRDREMAVLRRALADLRQGRGQIVSLMGEAGLGKSRLIDELRAEWEAAGGTPGGRPDQAVPMWRESRSPSYSATVPYGAFRQLIRNMCGVLQSDSPAAIREKIACECVHESAPVEQCERVSRAFEVLLGVDVPRNGGSARLEGEAFKNELFQSMIATWRGWARAAPVVLVFDDLHWADPASIELLLHLFQLVDEVAVLFLCAFRPERDAPAWQLKQTAETDYPHRYTEIVLAPLSNEESNALVNSLLAVADLPPELRILIQEKAEGNPFFVEEVVRELIELGVVIREEGGMRWQAVMPVDEVRLSIPDNLQALLTARIDRLEEEARHALQMASVIGRTFYYRVLQRVADMAAELDKQLRALQREEMIRELSREPELEYTFRHALTQEAAYNSILLKRRREFHRRVGDTLERLFPDRMEEYASQLAHHFYEARDPRALAYATLAGDEAFRLYANAEAARHYTQALEAAVWDPASQPDLSRLYGRRGRALELDARYDEALDNYRDMERLGRERGDLRLELAAVVARAVIHATPTPVYNAPIARELCDVALDLARQLSDSRAAARVLWIMMLLYHHEGELEMSIANGEHALSLARQLNLREELAYILNDLNIVYLSVGNIDRSREVGQEARQLWHELGNQPMLVDSLAGAVGAEYFGGNFDQAVRLSEEADRRSQAIGNLWGQAYSRMYVGYVYQERGEFGHAIEIMEECLRLAREAGFMAPQSVTQADLGLLYARLGDIDRGLDLIRQGLALTEAHIAPFQSWVLGQLARVQIMTGHLGAANTLIGEAHASLEYGDPGGFYSLPVHLAELELALAQRDHARALDLARELPVYSKSMRALAPEIAYLEGCALLGLGRVDEAGHVLNRARREARALGSRRILWPVLLSLSELEVQRGQQARAEALRCQAQDIVRYIADHIDRPNLRASFLNLPHVHKVVAEPVLRET